MKLIPNAGKVAKRASSMWLIYGGVGLGLAEKLLPEVAQFLPWYVPIAVTAAAAIARVIKQEKL